MIKLVIFITAGVAAVFAVEPLVKSTLFAVNPVNTVTYRTNPTYQYDPYYKNDNTNRNPGNYPDDGSYRHDYYGGDDGSYKHQYYENNGYYKNDYKNEPQKNNYYNKDTYNTENYYNRQPYYNRDPNYNRRDIVYNRYDTVYNKVNPNYNAYDTTYNRTVTFNNYNTNKKVHTYSTDADTYNVNKKYNTYTTGVDGNAKIISFQSNVAPDGTYEYSYNTDNGIAISESGVPNIVNDEEGNERVQGFYTYTSPEGVPVEVRYVADEFGFRPEGNVIPKNVVIGEVPAVARSIPVVTSKPVSIQQ